MHYAPPFAATLHRAPTTHPNTPNHSNTLPDHHPATRAPPPIPQSTPGTDAKPMLRNASHSSALPCKAGIRASSPCKHQSQRLSPLLHPPQSPADVMVVKTKTHARPPAAMLRPLPRPHGSPFRRGRTLHLASFCPDRRAARMENQAPSTQRHAKQPAPPLHLCASTAPFAPDCTPPPRTYTNRGEPNLRLSMLSTLLFVLAVPQVRLHASRNALVGASTV
jgi:hypothetical protein